MSKTKRERYLAELREKYIMDKHAIHAAGYDKGLEQGLQQAHEDLKQVAKKLKDEDVDINLIIKATGLTKEEIDNL